MLGFINNQTEWYREKSEKLNDLTLELRKSNPIAKQKAKAAINVVCALKNLEKAYIEFGRACTNIFNHKIGGYTGEANGALQGNSEYVFPVKLKN